MVVWCVLGLFDMASIGDEVRLNLVEGAAGVVVEGVWGAVGLLLPSFVLALYVLDAAVVGGVNCCPVNRVPFGDFIV